MVTSYYTVTYMVTSYYTDCFNVLRRVDATVTQILLNVTHANVF